MIIQHEQNQRYLDSRERAGLYRSAAHPV